MSTYLLLLAAVGFGSLSSICVRFTDAPSLILVLYRMGMAAAVLLPFAVRHRTAYRKLPLKIWGLSILSGIFMGMHFILYFQSLRMTQAASASVLVNMQVVFVAVLSWVLFRDKLTFRSGTALLCALAGAAVVTLSGGSFGGSLSGNVLALGSGLCFAFYMILSKECAQWLKTTEFTFILYSAATFLVLGILLVSGTPLAGYGTSAVLSAGCMTIFCTFLGHSIFNVCLRSIRPSVVSAVQLLDCIYNVFYGIFLFHEPLTVTTAAGGFLVIAGIAVFTIEKEYRKQSRQECRKERKLGSNTAAFT